MKGRKVDHDASAVYAAEESWRDEAREGRIRDLELARLHLADHLPPPLLARTTLEPMQSVPTRRRQTLAESETVMLRGETFRGPGWELHHVIRLGLPTRPAIIMHEAAHVILHATVGEHTHGEEFRDLMLWLAQRRYGVRRARRLDHHYQENLTT